MIDAVDRALRDRRSHADRRNSQGQMGYGKPIVQDFLVVAAAKGKLKSREDLAADYQVIKATDETPIKHR